MNERQEFQPQEMNEAGAPPAAQRAAGHQQRKAQPVRGIPLDPAQVLDSLRQRHGAEGAQARLPAQAKIAAR